ncbi:MAG: right-handed parallel beta-helix repeat-containing protein [Promethearchaeota archaeon]
MRKNATKDLLLVLILFVIVFSTNKNSTINIEQSDIKIVSRSFKVDYWDLTDTPIYIDDAYPNFDWGKTAAENSWCTGSGLWNDPYIIENILMDGSTASDCLTILNSDVYFIIKNCTIKNGGYDIKGIYLDNVTNGILVNNSFSNNERSIVIMEGHNVTVTENRFFNDASSINIWGYSDNITISRNIISSATHVGIILSQAKNTALRENNLSECGLLLLGIPFSNLVNLKIDTSNTVNGKPIYYVINRTGLDNTDFVNAGQIILVNCSDSIISGLDIAGSYIGISLFYCRKITLSKNNVYGNPFSGIELEYSFNNIITKNSIYNNNRGIYISSSSHNNTISENNCSSNDFIGILISGNNNTIVKNTITDDEGLVSNEYYGYGVDIEETSIDNIITGNLVNKYGSGYRISYSENNTIENNIANGSNFGIHLVNSNYTTVIGNKLVKSKFKSIFLEKHCEENVFQDNYCSSAINIHSPISNQFVGYSAPYFHIGIDLIYPIDSIWYSIGNNNFTCSFGGTIEQTEWSSLPDGPVVITFYANDSMNNLGSGEVIVLKDTEYPIIKIISPSPNDVFDNAPEFIVRITDDNIDTMWYTLNYGSTQFIFTTNGTIDQTTWSSLSEGDIIIIFFANDTYGSQTNQEVVVIKSQYSETTSSESSDHRTHWIFLDIILLLPIFTLIIFFRNRKKV